jgi:simple sugar transport system permease protein
MNLILNWQFVQTSIELSTPITLAAMGGVLCAQVGVFNVTLEGFMLMGAFLGVVVAYYSLSVWAGLAAGCAGVVLFALIFAAFVVDLHADEIVIGLAFNLLALGLTTFLLRAMFHVAGFLYDPRIPQVPTVQIPGLDRVPVLGPLLDGYSVLVYVAWAAVLVTWFVLYKLRVGMHLRAAGESPEALETAGVSVRRMRYLAIAISGVLSALGGMYLSLGELNQFTENMTAGRGFIAVAAVLFGFNRPVLAFIGALIFGIFQSLSIQIQSANVPANFALMIPYAVTIVVLVIVSIRKRRTLVAEGEAV